MTLMQVAEMIAGPSITENQRAFFRAAENGTAALSETEARIRLWNDQVSLTLIPLNIADRASVLLQDIQAVKPGQGDGGRAMAWLCSLADQNKIMIELMVNFLYADGSKLKTEADLRGWYRGYGFRDGPMMRRSPGSP